MVFVIIWFLDHFTLEYVPPVNSTWIVTSASLFHVWATNLKTFFIFSKLSVLTSNNVIWVGLFFLIHQNFLLIFFICKLKGLYLNVTACDGLLMLSLDLFNSSIKPTWYDVFQDVLFKCFSIGFFAFDYDIHDSKD